jgi:hypothetical protein
VARAASSIQACSWVLVCSTVRPAADTSRTISGTRAGRGRVSAASASIAAPSRSGEP